MGKSRVQLRREAEAAEALSSSKSPAKKKKAAKRKTTARKTREKAPERKRVVWVIYSGSMKEEGRFAYDQKEAADDKLAALRARATKKLYFMQLVKELVTDSPTPITPVSSDPELDEAPVVVDPDAEPADPDAEVDGDGDGDADDALDVDIEADFAEDDDEDDDSSEPGDDEE